MDRWLDCKDCKDCKRVNDGYAKGLLGGLWE